MLFKFFYFILYFIFSSFSFLYIDSEKFEINSTTGDVTVKAGLDREDVAQYTLVVNVSDYIYTTKDVFLSRVQYLACCSPIMSPEDSDFETVPKFTFPTEQSISVCIG